MLKWRRLERLLSGDNARGNFWDSALACRFPRFVVEIAEKMVPMTNSRSVPTTMGLSLLLFDLPLYAARGGYTIVLKDGDSIILEIPAEELRMLFGIEPLSQQEGLVPSPPLTKWLRDLLDQQSH